MLLFFNCGVEFLVDPSAEDIEDKIRDESDFCIASESEDSMTYLQYAVATQEPWGLLLEYQEGSLERHFRALGSPTIDEVVSAFRRYCAGDMTWKSDFRWEGVSV